MKHHIAVKFLAVVLCALALLVCIGSAVGVILIAEGGLYANSVAQLQQQAMEEDLEALSRNLAKRCAAEHLSNCTQAFLDIYIDDYRPFEMADDNAWFYTIEDENGKLLDTNYESAENAEQYEFLVRPQYPVILDYRVESHFGGSFVIPIPEIPMPTLPQEQPDATDPTQATLPQYVLPGTVRPAEDDSYLFIEGFGWTDEQDNEHIYELGICQGPVYRVTLHLMPGAYVQQTSAEWELMDIAHTHRFTLLYTLFCGLLVAAISAVYLCCSAGKKPGCHDVQPGGLNRIPLDLYAVITGGALVLLTSLCGRLLIDHLLSYDPQWLIVLMAGLMGFTGCLLFTGFLFACAAQFKLRSGFWWRKSITGRAIALLWKGLVWAAGGLRRIYGRTVALLPYLWQWLLGAATVLLLIILGFASHSKLLILLAVLLGVGLLGYACYAFGTLLESARRMSEGNLSAKVSTRHLTGCFADFAKHLNTLTDVVTVASQKQAQSERMKAELVTNVSHDIKTPLTSIINYVDLLQKTDNEEDAAAYLEVLERQSLRLKKLIDDLMEMSKASTGNMAVEVTAVDATETINQALGEFADKLEKAQLTPVFTAPQDTVTMLADGRLTWRVLSNLLSNAVKYALPGTRLYVDLLHIDGNVLISLKNISKEPLNISSDELMDRFVRGDVSRNTEGSGLGLNIAKSLMELQKGQLQLLVDGDLFKATLIFPEA